MQMYFLMASCVANVLSWVFLCEDSSSTNNVEESAASVLRAEKLLYSEDGDNRFLWIHWTLSIKLHGVMCKKIIIFRVIFVRTSNLKTVLCSNNSILYFDFCNLCESNHSHQKQEGIKHSCQESIEYFNPWAGERHIFYINLGLQSNSWMLTYSFFFYRDSLICY